MTPHSSSTIVRGTDKANSVVMFRFLYLPREIRDMIYVHALVTEQILYFEGFKEPILKDLVLLAIIARQSLSIPLLNVCKTINAEATPIFYGRNTFALREIESRKPSPFTSQTTLIHRVVVNLPSAGFYTTCQYGSHWEIQPLLDLWRVMLRKLQSFTNLDMVELDVSELCDAAFHIKYAEGYLESLHGRSSHEGSPSSLKYMAGQILSDLSAALAPSRGERKPWNRLKLRVTGGYEWERKAICEKWDELGAEYVKKLPADDDDILYRGWWELLAKRISVMAVAT